jgi:hypothetical protein
MADDRQYFLTCPQCKARLQVGEVFPNGFRFCFFSEFEVENGKFVNKKSYPSITNQHRKGYKRKEPEPTFKEKEHTTTLF